MTFSQVLPSSTHRLGKIKSFLEHMGLDFSPDIELFVIAQRDNAIVACGGIAGKVLKNIAIDESVQGEGVALMLMSELLKVAYSSGRDELFVFTKPMYKDIFESCGFKYIDEAAGKIILMENRYNIEEYKRKLRKLKQQGDIIGSIVMNCNPFTLGHRYLVEQASQECAWVHLFIVKEDASFFSFNDRKELIHQGLADLRNVTIHDGSDYIISKATFPTYFIKDKGQIDALFTELDLNIFRHHIAPTLGITHRFVGKEPLCAVTNEYNQQMKKILSRPDTSPAIEVVERERIAYKDEPISASRVRRLMQEKNVEEISHLVPPTTLAFIQTMVPKNEDNP